MPAVHKLLLEEALQDSPQVNDMHALLLSFEEPIVSYLADFFATSKSMRSVDYIVQR